MTNMGDDGAAGLLEKRQAGAEERGVALNAISREILQYGAVEREGE